MIMHLCYIDESGTSDIPGNTSHFVLAGLSIPIQHWRDCDGEIESIKKRYALGDSEIHIAWLLRPYLEQRRIADFDSLDYSHRRSQVEGVRKAKILKLQKAANPKLYKQTRKNYRQTEAYIHLTYDERRGLAKDIAKCIANWGFARLFAECIDKVYFDPSRAAQPIDAQSFEQVVSRFEQFLQIIGKGDSSCYGLIIHDNNETVAKKHTALMKSFHQKGTLWTKIEKIIETPLFVDSQLTSMVQIADVCSYAIRRYLENREEELFDLVFQRADRKDGVVVGVRHFSDASCTCKICTAHRKPAP
jgi:hypothetical protein